MTSVLAHRDIRHPAMWLITIDVMAGVGPYQLTSGSHVIGRGRNCDLVIREPTLSRRHARICVSNQRDFLLEDLGSKNGTFIDDAKVSRQPLLPKSIIRLGDVRLFLSPTPTELCPESAEETKSARGTRRKPVSALPLANLTPVQREVFELVIEGCNEVCIAERTGRSFHTIHHHVQAIFRKLGVHSRTDLLSLVLNASKK
jgi:pSer/pThr/pTyr-binding forkhead associated (FHA) protein